MSDTQPIGIKGLRALSQSQLITRLQASERRNEQVEQKKQELTDELVRKHQQQMSHHVSYHEAVTERDDFKRQLNEQQGQINTLSSEWQKQQGQHQAQLNHLNNKLNQKQTKIDRLQALVVSRNVSRSERCYSDDCADQDRTS